MLVANLLGLIQDEPGAPSVSSSETSTSAASPPSVPSSSPSSSLPSEQDQSGATIVATSSNWPTGGFDASWMTLAVDPSFESETAPVPATTILRPRQVWTPIPRDALEPLLPRRFNSPSVHIDPGRPGYRVESISLGTLDDETFDRFRTERIVPVEDGRIALVQSGGGNGRRGGMRISGYGFEHAPAFEIAFVPGSVQALYLSARSQAHSPSEERVSLVIASAQTPSFHCSVSSRADFSETGSVRVAALDDEHYRLVPYLSRHLLVELSFARDHDDGYLVNLDGPLAATFDNFLFDLDQLDGFPSATPVDVDSFTNSSCQGTGEGVSRFEQRYSRAAIERLSTAFGKFDSPSLAFPLEAIVRDGTLTPLDVAKLVDEHVEAWVATAEYDDVFVEDVLYELRTTLVEKRANRGDAFRRRRHGLATFQDDDLCDRERYRSKGVDGEAEAARVAVLDRRNAALELAAASSAAAAPGGPSANDLLEKAKGAGAQSSKKIKGHRTMTDDEKRTRSLYWSKSVVVTPSGTIRIQGRSIEKSNSIIRSNFDGVSHFLRVSFKDEDDLQLATVGGFDAEAQHELFDGSITRVLKNGLILGGRKFEFLSYSQASLREGSAVFLAPFTSTTVRNGLRSTRLVDARHVRARMGQFDKCEKQPAMLGARWSQRFTTTSGSVVLRDQQIHRIDDIVERSDEPLDGETCHTDGAGLISPKLRDLMCEALIENRYRLSSTAPFPSVFQFRLGGYKGVLAVDNTQAGQGVGIAVRPSQEKFSGFADTADASFVLNIAEAFDRPRPLKLNRPLISALEDLGIEASVFLRYQREAVESLTLPSDESVFEAAHRQLVSSSLGGPSGFQKLLKSFSRLNSLPTSLLEDVPFLRQALDVVRIRVLRSYKYHASIPLPNCRLLVGVPDEDGILDEDEVFVALRDPESPETVEYLEGTVAVTRSPTIDAGDVRVVRAIGRPPDKSRLTSLENCIVFPTRGKRSLSSMMGGGDLDGDTYQIITLPDLIPERTFPPMSHAAKPPIAFDRPATVDDVADCFVHYLENNLVGAIATRHLFVSDRSPLHGRDPIAIRLAELHSHSVDSPKTGQVVRNDDLPRLPDYLRRERPDFLQPESREYALDMSYYASDRALGQLYRDIEYEQIRVPEELVDPRASSSSEPSNQLERTSTFETMCSIVDERISDVLNAPLELLESRSEALRPTSVSLRDAFCSHLRDLATVHAFPRNTTAGEGTKLSEVEIFAATNLATSTRDTVARGNAVVAMGTQLDSLVEWLKRYFGPGASGLDKMRAAWVVGRADEAANEWRYGARAFGWITLSILLEHLFALEEETKQVTKLRGAKEPEAGCVPLLAEEKSGTEQAHDLIDLDFDSTPVTTAPTPSCLPFPGPSPAATEDLLSLSGAFSSAAISSKDPSLSHSDPEEVDPPRLECADPQPSIGLVASTGSTPARTSPIRIRPSTQFLRRLLSARSPPFLPHARQSSEAASTATATMTTSDQQSPSTAAATASTVASLAALLPPPCPPTADPPIVELDPWQTERLIRSTYDRHPPGAATSYHHGPSSSSQMRFENSLHDMVMTRRYRGRGRGAWRSEVWNRARRGSAVEQGPPDGNGDRDEDEEGPQSSLSPPRPGSSCSSSSSDSTSSDPDEVEDDDDQDAPERMEKNARDGGHDVATWSGGWETGSGGGTGGRGRWVKRGHRGGRYVTRGARGFQERHGKKLEA